MAARWWVLHGAHRARHFRCHWYIFAAQWRTPELEPRWDIIFVSDLVFCCWFPLLLVSLSVVAVPFLSGLFLFCLLLFWFLSGCLRLLSGLLVSVLRLLALVCFLLARSRTWGICLSFPSSGNFPGFLLVGVRFFELL